ncbi:MAG: hypothetical protein KDA63_20250 [Planctomycetales bacterium]|nr:hypothetical protein [Planctomycetales bacterium]
MPGYHEKFGEIRTGGLLLIYYWLHIVAGWVVCTFLVAALTGLIRR